MWIAAIDGGMVSCGGGGLGIPDRDTDAEGTTEWRLPPRAGGWSNAGCRVYINGDALSRYPQLPLHFNSPDLSGDLVVSLIGRGVVRFRSVRGLRFPRGFQRRRGREPHRCGPDVRRLGQHLPLAPAGNGICNTPFIARRSAVG